MTGPLDDIRADIVARRDKAMRIIEREQRCMDCAVAELEAHDRAVALFRPEPAEPVSRRDISALVLARLTDQPQTAEQLAKAIGAKPRQVTKALQRLYPERADDEADGWVRVGGLAL